MNKKRKITIHNISFEIGEDDFFEMERERDRFRRLKNREKKLGIISLNALDDEKGSGESKIADTNVNVEDQVIRTLMVEKLRTCLSYLSNDELYIIEQLIYQEKSEREISRILGISHTAVGKRCEEQ